MVSLIIGVVIGLGLMQVPQVRELADTVVGYIAKKVAGE